MCSFKRLKYAKTKPRNCIELRRRAREAEFGPYCAAMGHNGGVYTRKPGVRYGINARLWKEA